MEDFNCFDDIITGSSVVDPVYKWKSTLSGFIDNNLVFVYEFTGSENKNIGIVYANIIGEDAIF